MGKGSTSGLPLILLSSAEYYGGRSDLDPKRTVNALTLSGLTYKPRSIQTNRYGTATRERRARE